jgi:4-hydroxy-tetrahydrodipicolinate reductase
MTPLRIALVGYGKMGKLIGSLAPEYGMEVVATFNIDDTPTPAQITTERLNGAHVAIEFTHPESAPGNLLRLAELKIPTVCGTTGWYEELPQVAAAFSKSGTPLIYGANYSIGVNLFDRIIREAARLFEGYPEYDAYGWEAHHNQKKDAPSGTLLKLAGSIKDVGFTREINLSSTRAGFIPGTHEIGFDSPADTITLRHTARNREGFARGALFAAKKVLELEGIHEFSEVLFHGN